MNERRPLPRVFRAVDGSVAVQLPERLQEDLYELVRVGPELADLNLTRGYLITGDMMVRIKAGPAWHEMRR